MTLLTIGGIVFILFLIIGVGIYSGSKVKDTQDFLTGGGKAGSWLVSGAIMGSLVSSQATIGTAQLAFDYGLSAWWFTLGSGIGCLFLALCFSNSLRRSNYITELQIISEEYGRLAGNLGSILSSIGIFISVLAQVVACTGLMTVLFPNIHSIIAAILSAGMMCIYVVLGGAWGTGLAGIVKLFLLYAASVIGMIAALSSSGGINGLISELNHALTQTTIGSIQQSIGLSQILNHIDLTNRFFNLTARGAAKDIGSGISLLLGVLSTQTYAQAIWSAESDLKAKKGALLSAFLIPPLGIAGICIGIFMRAHYITQSEINALAAANLNIPDMPVLSNTIQVFPTFVLNHMHPLVAGIILGTLLITVIGGGAGLSLGMATLLIKNIYQYIIRHRNTPEKELLATRITITAIFITTIAIISVISNNTINDLGFLSMGLRGTVVFIPLCCALWLKGKVHPAFILISIVLSPLSTLLGEILSVPFDSLFLGMGVSLICCISGCFAKTFFYKT